MRKKWSEEEIDLLKKYYPTCTKDEIENIFKKYNRTYSSIENKANSLKLSKFYNQEKKDGYKVCKRCMRELPRDRFHFDVDKTCKDGLRNVCRECNPKSSGFLNENYKIPKQWTVEDENLLKRVYYNYTNSEIIYMFFQDCTTKMLQDKAYRLGISGNKNKYVIERINLEKSKANSGENAPNYGKHLSEETKRKLSESKIEYYKTHDGTNKGRKFSKETRNKMSLIMLEKGRWKGELNPRHINPLKGEMNGNWKGGKTPIYFELRTQIDGWKKSSMKNCNYKCVITGEDFDNIHHLHPFRDIVNEAFLLTKIPIKYKVEEYSIDEFNTLSNKVRELHDIYGLGVCLCKPIHKLFHDTYGYTNTTKEQFEEFKLRLKSGEFDLFLKENNLSLII